MRRATFGPRAVVTTCIEPPTSAVATARGLADELGIPYVARGSLTVKRLLEVAGAGDALVVLRNALVLRGQSGAYSFHPSMAALRVLRLARGGGDPLVAAGGLTIGDRFLDCTLGLGSDAIVASYVVGPAGRVHGLESCGLLAVVARDGLMRYGHQDAELVSAMRRISVFWSSALDYLASCHVGDYDVVYFDPLFPKPQPGASYLATLRRIADPSGMVPEAAERAARVAGRRVVVKTSRSDRATAELLAGLGFRVLHESGSGKVAYLCLETGNRRLETGNRRSPAAGCAPHGPRCSPAPTDDRSRRVDEARPPLVVIVGPTAVGKTEIAVRAALLLDAEIVSADSMQVYRGMDIGTAKPRPEDTLGVPHHLIDVVDPASDFSVASYRRLALEAISAIQARGRLAMLVGGTGLYVKAVIGDLALPGSGPDWELRRSLAGQARVAGGSRALWHRLEQLDPETALLVHPNDTRRIIRALEVCLKSGKPLSQLKRSGGDRDVSPFRLAMVGLTCSRSDLYARIEARVDAMVSAGLVHEVESLVRRGLLVGRTASQALGYREIRAYLNGLLTLGEAIRLIKRNTRRYAKRQLTWFKGDKRITWVDVNRFATKEQVAAEIARIVAGKLASR